MLQISSHAMLNLLHMLGLGISITLNAVVLYWCNNSNLLSGVTRYQELEEALTLAEQHLQQHDKDASVGNLQEQVQRLQADLQRASAKTEALQADLQTAEAARLKATDELTASLNQQKALQVGLTCSKLQLQAVQT